MKNTILFMSIIILILLTTFIKNSTKDLEEKIFTLNENISLLNEKFEILKLENNYLTSPLKLSEYHKIYFDRELEQLDIENFEIIYMDGDEYIIKKFDFVENEN
tara:strand:- start:162 stop:473 length:312 start_codon:yes stop_codon:yes gene_type:complete